MNRLMIQINNLSQVLEIYNQVKVYRSDTIDGVYAELTDANTRINIIPEEDQYFYTDLDGGSTHYYKTAYYHSSGSPESTKSEPRLGGTEEEKIGYTFGNYRPEPNEWGKLYTADDMRYTMLFGIDCVGSDVAGSEFTDAQFDNIVLEAIGEFELFLTMDIRKKVYKTEPDDALIQGRIWREGVDYTDEEDSYDFDSIQWGNYGFLQLRHWPILSVERAVWQSPVGGEIMDLIEADWLRVRKKMGQLNFFPKGGFAYGPYSVYGPLWHLSAGGRYPQSFEIDYSTGYKTADQVPEGLRSVIGKYATIKALAVVGDGILAGFSSQSVSLDGLSESFSSTQSATSIGADSITAFGRIEDVYHNKNEYIGRKLHTVNVSTGKVEYKSLLDVVRHEVGTKKCYKVSVNTNSIIVTEDHSLFTFDLCEIKGDDIRKGTVLKMINGSSIVMNVQLIEGLKYVYDFSVQDNENFIANDFLCHNSAYFGARIKQYSDEITAWLKANRYKMGPPPISFVGATL